MPPDRARRATTNILSVGWASTCRIFVRLHVKHLAIPFYFLITGGSQGQEKRGRDSYGGKPIECVWFTAYFLSTEFWLEWLLWHWAKSCLVIHLVQFLEVVTWVFHLERICDLTCGQDLFYPPLSPTTNHHDHFLSTWLHFLKHSKLLFRGRQILLIAFLCLTVWASQRISSSH